MKKSCEFCGGTGKIFKENNNFEYCYPCAGSGVEHENANSFERIELKGPAIEALKNRKESGTIGPEITEAELLANYRKVKGKNAIKKTINNI